MSSKPTRTTPSSTLPNEPQPVAGSMPPTALTATDSEHPTRVALAPVETTAVAEPALTAEEQQRLERLEQKLQLVRDRVGAVVRGYATGLFLYGEGGIGKSYTVLSELERLKADFIVFNSRMTGRGLYNALEQFPSSVHVLEDMEQLTRDKGAQGVLRSALAAQRKEGDTGPLERPVTWTTYQMEHRFVFTGSIIMIANRPLGDAPELRAVKTRIPCIHLEATAYELRALMRSVALKGFAHDGKRMEPSECVEVNKYLVEQSLTLRRSLDMRLLVSCFQDFLQWQEGDAGCHWKDLVTARLHERPTSFEAPVDLGSRAERLQKERELVAKIVSETDDRKERLRLWKEQAGKSEAALYRRIGELQREGAVVLRK